MRLNKSRKHMLILALMLSFCLMFNVGFAGAGSCDSGDCCGECDCFTLDVTCGQDSADGVITVSKTVVDPEEISDPDAEYSIKVSGPEYQNTLLLASGEQTDLTGLASGTYTILEEPVPTGASESYSPSGTVEVQSGWTSIWATVNYPASLALISSILPDEIHWTLAMGDNDVAEGTVAPGGTVVYNTLEEGKYTFFFSCSIANLNSDICPSCVFGCASFSGESEELDCPGIPQDAAVTVTNTYGDSGYGTLHIKKIVDGPGPDGPYDVALCPLQPAAFSGDGRDGENLNDGCTHLQVNKGINYFANETYDFAGMYNVYEDPTNSTHQGYLVFLADPDWEYDEDYPIAGDGVEGFETPDESTPITIDPAEDTYLVIVNYFEKESGQEPGTEPKLLIEKRIGTGSISGNQQFTVQLQKWVCEFDYNDDIGPTVIPSNIESCGWETLASYVDLSVNNPKTFLLSELMCEFGEGQYRVVEIEPELSKWKSVTYKIDGSATNEFKIDEDVDENIIVLVTNNFETSSSGGDTPGGDNPPGGVDEPGGSDEPVIVPEPGPSIPAPVGPEIPAPVVPEIIIVPEPAPELPKTGAPIAAGLGLLLAAGGLAIRRIKK